MKHMAWIVAATALAAHAHVASAQTWPSKPIRAVIPFAAGSLTDVLPRVVFDHVGKQLGQTIVVENRTGAGGTIGVAAVARAEPDGHTILANSSAHTIAPAIYPNLSYDTARDLTAVISLGQSPLVMIMSPVQGPQDGAGLRQGRQGEAGLDQLHLGRRRDRDASGGGALHPAAAGIKAVHIPHRGGTEALTDVIAGRVDFYFCPIGTAVPQISAGRVLALAVSSPNRAAALPAVPSTLEAGYADSDYTFWVGVFVPAKTPGAIVERLHRETQKAMQIAAVKSRLAELGADPMDLSPAQFDALVKKEIVTSAALAKAAGLKPN